VLRLLLLPYHLVLLLPESRPQTVRSGAGFYFHEHPNCVVEAVNELRTDRREHLMKVYKCDKSYESLEKLVLDSKIEAVFIATPAPDHARHVIATLNAGKHVLCAVPAAWTLEECDKLRDASETHWSHLHDG
jgi:predicted dehydrogenase